MTNLGLDESGDASMGLRLPAWDFATPKPKEFGIISTPTPRRGNHST
jgi:hypothetical protein